MIAFHGKNSVKKEYLARVLSHRKADQLVQNYGYFKDGKGCAVGCTIHSAAHSAYETELGIPTVLARLEDSIFEGLPVKEARMWPTQFLSAIKPGADLSQVWNKFAVWLLVDKKDGVIKYAKSDRSRVSIQAVADLYLDLMDGKTVPIEAWREAKSNAAYAYAYAAAADAAAHAAAAAAATYATAYAADAAAYAADDADADDADAATAYAADDARTKAREQARVRQAKKLLSLLKAAK